MNVFEAIQKRASVRHFSDKPIEKEILEQLVDAGRRAPTGRNVQPWEFIVVTEFAVRERLAEITDYGKFIIKCPACIVVYSADTKYYLEDGAAAVENILLAATGLHIGSCWVAGDKKPYTGLIDKLLNVPAGYKLVAIIALGYPASLVTPTRKRPLNEVIHWEHF